MDSYHMVGRPQGGKWHLATGKSGRRWLYDPEGSVVWVDGGEGSRGCGGSTIEFELVDGTSVEFKGPWCSNSDAFLVDCGIDVTSNHWTWGCIGTEYGYDENAGRSCIGNIIWFDPEPVKGKFDRIDLIAWKMQLENTERKLYSYWSSHGGSGMGGVSEPFRLRMARGEKHAMIIKEMFDL